MTFQLTTFNLAQALAVVAEETGLGTLFNLLAVVVLVFVNGFFVAAEFSLVGLRDTRLAEMLRQKVRGAQAVARGKRHLDLFVAASQLGITMASLALGWVGEPAVASLIEPLFGFLHSWSSTAAHAVSLTLTFLFVTTLHIVLGEQLPKMWAIQNPERSALLTAGPTELFVRVFHVFILALSWMTSVMLRAFGLKAASHVGAVYSEEEVRHILDAREQAGVAEPRESEIINRVFSFFDLVAREVMVPRTALVSLPRTATLSDLLELATRRPHDRYPVHRDSLDHMEGLVVFREAVVALQRGHVCPEEPVTSVMRQLPRVPGSLPVGAVMDEMQRLRVRAVLVVDEFGGTDGIITQDDLVVRLTGELERPDEELVADENGWVMSGRALLEDLTRRLGWEYADPHNDTVGGAVFSRLGRRPSVGDQAELGDLTFRVEEVEGLRILRLRAHRREEPGQPEGAWPGDAVTEALRPPGSF